MKSGERDVLKLEHATKQFGGLTAVGDVTFTIREGEIFGLIGPNGAGKNDHFQPDQRRVRFERRKDPV